ncbi:MAG: hypothetical protein IT487_16515 [Chromatiaceae bacterium]|nr:hypothetical protein [Chromatiaceae bacterium]
MIVQATKALVKSRLGLSFEGPGEQPLRRAIERRLAATGAAASLDYVARLAQDPDELDALASLLTINETYFYREPEHLRLLTDHLAPELLRTRPPGRPVRILCVGCATGEEPYSIRMALRERWGNESDRDFAITGADLDREALAAARRGRYRPLAFRALDPERQTRWFTATPEGDWRLADSIRGSVDFLQLNLLAATYPDALAGQDLIFYRNLSIYFDAPTRQVVMGRLGDLLQPAGYLLVGLAETLANDYGLLTLRDQGGVWYFSKQPAAPEPGPGAKPPRRTLPTRAVTLRPPPPHGLGSMAQTTDSLAPSPLVGEGWGEGAERLPRARLATAGPGAGAGAGAGSGAGVGAGSRIGVGGAGSAARPPSHGVPLRPPLTPSPTPWAAASAATAMAATATAPSTAAAAAAAATTAAATATATSTTAATAKPAIATPATATPATATPAIATPATTSPATTKAATAKAAATAAQRYQQALTLARAERFPAALETLAPLCAAPTADPAHLTLRAQILHAQGDLTGAEETARQVLAADPWALEALVLLGRISRAQGRLEAAVEHLRHAIYQRPDYWPAHGELAECRRAAGQDEAARREYGIALRLLAARPEVLAQAGPLPPALSWMDLRQLYQARLARLGHPD